MPDPAEFLIVLFALALAIWGLGGYPRSVERRIRTGELQPGAARWVPWTRFAGALALFTLILVLFIL